jgi:hypothetical protein
MSTLEASPFIVPEVVAESSRSCRVLHWSLLGGSVGILAMALLLEVQAETRVAVPLVNRTLPELCYWRTMFGIDCPGCGLTRCFVSAAHGNVADAWRYNPVGLFLFAAVVFQLPYRPWQLWRLATGRGELNTVALPYAMLAVSVLLLLQWFWRLLA